VGKSMDALRREIVEIAAIAREQAIQSGAKDQERFVRRMVEAAMRGKIDRLMLDERAAR